MARTQIVAELASNHGGNIGLAHEMIQAAAGAGCDYVKLQLYDASRLKPDDPQKAWLQQAQVERPFLDACLAWANIAGVKLAASVFGIPQAQMALAAGLTTVKLGSGESGRDDLMKECVRRFKTVWVSVGLARQKRLWDGHVVTFYGVSQYPTPYMRGLAALMQRPAGYAFAWSDHGLDLEVAKEAILHGAT
jgi:N,N'-diacetyllegionaminate synthase